MSGVKATRFHCYLSIAFFLGAFMAPVLYAAKASAWDRYSTNSANNCANSACHGDFLAGDPSNHDDHTDMLPGDCNICHTGGGGTTPVFTDESTGVTGFPPIGCMGCHGRDEDTEPGAGLRQHHFNAGLTTACDGCHSADFDPINYTPVGEDVVPPYYFTPDTAHPDKPTDPCDDGLDNDGDFDYDREEDADCWVCGNNVVDPNEDCDDGNTTDGDCCSASCEFEASGSACPDGEFCNGDETCDGAGTCQAGTQADCDDGVDCTDDSCNEGTDQCDNVANDANCSDDGLFCNGDEFCDTVSDCSFSGDPCPAGAICDDGTDTCEPAPGCGDGVVGDGEECDDDNNIDGDCCDSFCQFEDSGSDCSEGVFCNGDETCDGAGTCQAGTSVDCDDGVGCTADSCNEATDSCDNTPNDSMCDDGLYCTGEEMCDPVDDCVSAGDPCESEGTSCNEDEGQCVGGGGGGGCSLGGGTSNSEAPFASLLCVCGVLLYLRRRKRVSHS